MFASASTKRRWVVVSLLFVIGLAGASILRTTVERELIAPGTAYTLGATLSPSPAQRQFYRLRREHAAALEELNAAENRLPGNEANDSVASEAWRQARERLAKVTAAYEQFLEKHTEHLGARVAYADLLDHLGNELGAIHQRENALTLDQKNPLLWNQLANHYAHCGSLAVAFDHYAQAIALAPSEPTYYHNLGTAIFLYRRDAMRYYHINEQQVFDRALELFGKAVKLDPNNLELAADVAMTYYGIKPLRVEGALSAWRHLHRSARTGVQRQSAALNLARISLEAGQFEAARGYLSEVTHQAHQRDKGILTNRLAEKQDPALGMKATPAVMESK